MEQLDYLGAGLNGFTLIGIVVAFVVLQVLAGVFQAIGSDLWQRFKKRQ